MAVPHKVEGELRVVLNKPFYVAGERVDGAVDLDLRTPGNLICLDYYY